MAGALGNLDIQLSADTVKFMSDMGKAAYAVESSIKKMQSAFSTLQASAAGLGLVFGASQFVAGVKNMINQADELGKLSQKVGVAVEDLSALKYAAELSDVSREGLTTGLKKLATNMFDASAGSKEALAIFKGLNIEFESAPGKLLPTDAVLLKLADKFHGMEDGAAKSALAVKLFGRNGLELIPFLNQGATGITKLKDELEKLGGLMTGEMAKKSEEFNDNLKSLGVAANKLKIEVGNQALPALIEITNAMKEAAKESGFLMAAWVGLGGVASNLIRSSDASQLRDVQAKIKSQQVLMSQKNLPGSQAAAYQRQYNALVQQEAEIAGRLANEGAFPESNTPGLPKRKFTPDATAFSVDKATKEKKDSLDIGKQWNEQMERDAQAVSETADALGIYNKRMDDRARAEARAEGLGIDLADKTTDQLNEEIDLRLKSIDQMNEIEEINMRLLAGFDESGHAIKENSDETKKWNSTAHELGLSFSSAFEDAIVNGKKLRDVFTGLAQDLLRLGVRKLLTEPLAEAATAWLKGLGGGGGGGGFSILSLFGGGGGGAAAGASDLAGSSMVADGAGGLVAALADGGPVAAGQPYLVGERGPELFVPGISGGIVPNGAGGGGGPVFNIDARGADVAAVARLERMVERLDGTLERRAVAANRQASGRGM